MSKTVLVLGAGFTKAFFPRAPLLVDYYNLEALGKNYKGFWHVRQILRSELERRKDGRVDIERLLTRLHGGMPYDPRGETYQHEPIIHDLIEAILMRILRAKQAEHFWTDLEPLAKYIVTHGLDVITFNYDDTLDRAMLLAGSFSGDKGSIKWSPDRGYGFFCKSAIHEFLGGWSVGPDPSSLLLKLHGSTNWRIRLGAPKPYALGSILHYEDWPKYTRTEGEADVESHLEPTPFVVPPVLVKSDLSQEPLLRLVWARAKEKLEEAEEVIFVGYSMPSTDVAGSFLFTESIKLPKARIRIVNKAGTPTAKKAIREAYQRVFPDLKAKEFAFDGALRWARRFVTETHRRLAPGD
jgi:hypothetical protein